MSIINLQSSKKSSLVLFGKKGGVEDKKYNTAMVDPDTGKFVYPEGYSISTEDLQRQIDEIVAKGIQYEIVDLLPPNPKEGIFYYLRTTNPTSVQQQYIEYTWVVDEQTGSHWEKWGDDYNQLMQSFAAKDASNLTEENKQAWERVLGFITPTSEIESGILDITSESPNTSVNVFDFKIEKRVIEGNTASFVVDLEGIILPAKLYIRDDIGTNITYDIINEDLIIKEIISDDLLNLTIVFINNTLECSTENTDVSMIKYILLQI